MGIKDMFKASKIKAENEDLKSLLTPELKEAANAQGKVRELEEQLAKLEGSISQAKRTLRELDAEILEKREQIITLDDDLMLQEYGLYQPQYDFQKADEYKARLTEIREEQKAAVRGGTAVTGNNNWTVNGSKSQGKKMVKDMQKLLLRAFNSECDELVEKVKYNSYDSALKRMYSSAEAISKLGAIMGVSITKEYLDLKRRELRLALEYRIKKEEEKEAIKEARAEMREAAKLQRELEEERKKMEKEQTHYQKALLTLMKQLETADESAKADLLEKKAELEGRLSDIDVSMQDLDYRAANQKAGYVYVISNIGSFGPDVYKIGMTRRLVPQERVDELGDASVPFNFDVHAMIFSDDAPKLEAALHNAFSDRKLNMVNPRREFFRVSLDEIKAEVKKNFDKTVEFVAVPDADQYRISERMRAEL